MFLVVVRGCTGEIRSGNAPPRSEPVAEYKPVARAIRKADRVLLYEGLPHQTCAPELLKKELEEKKTVEYHGFPFYAELLDLKEDDAKRLIALSADPKSVRQKGKAKLCGGFHPDYMIEYHVGEDVYRVLVCLGCGEVKVYGPKAALYCDMADAAYETFRAVLIDYQKNRPKEEKRNYR
jgi:hypothetical protein